MCAFHGPDKQGVFCEILCAFISSCVRDLNVPLSKATLDAALKALLGTFFVRPVVRDG